MLFRFGNEKKSMKRASGMPPLPQVPCAFSGHSSFHLGQRGRAGGVGGRLQFILLNAILLKNRPCTNCLNFFKQYGHQFKQYGHHFKQYGHHFKQYGPSTVQYGP